VRELAPAPQRIWRLLSRWRRCRPDPQESRDQAVQFRSIPLRIRPDLEAITFRVARWRDIGGDLSCQRAERLLLLGEPEMHVSPSPRLLEPQAVGPGFAEFNDYYCRIQISSVRGIMTETGSGRAQAERTS